MTRAAPNRTQGFRRIRPTATHCSRPTHLVADVRGWTGPNGRSLLSPLTASGMRPGPTPGCRPPATSHTAACRRGAPSPGAGRSCGPPPSPGPTPPVLVGVGVPPAPRRRTARNPTAFAPIRGFRPRITAGITSGRFRDRSRRITAVAKNALSNTATRAVTPAPATWSSRRVRTAVNGSPPPIAVSPRVYRPDPPSTHAVASVWPVVVDGDPVGGGVRRRPGSRTARASPSVMTGRRWRVAGGGRRSRGWVGSTWGRDAWGSSRMGVATTTSTEPHASRHTSAAELETTRLVAQ